MAESSNGVDVPTHSTDLLFGRVLLMLILRSDANNEGSFVKKRESKDTTIEPSRGADG